MDSSEMKRYPRTLDELYRERNFKTHDKGTRRITCVYCKYDQHRNIDCEKLKRVDEWREFLRKNRLCFNCAGKYHSVANCRSRNCARCNQRHHTSLCKTEESLVLGMLEESRETIQPTLVAAIKGKKFRILLKFVYIFNIDTSTGR